MNNTFKFGIDPKLIGIIILGIVAALILLAQVI